MGIFSSRQEYIDRMNAAELTPDICTYRAANDLVSFAGGVSINTTDEVMRAFKSVGNEPQEIMVDVAHKDPMKHRADVICAACGMCVEILGGYVDLQRVGLKDDQRACPVFTTE